MVPKLLKTEALQRSLRTDLFQYWEHVHQENHGKTKKAGVKMKEAVFLQEVKEIQLLKMP